MKWFMRQRTQPITTGTRFLKVTINGLIAAYLYGALHRVLDLGSFMVIRVSRTLF